MNRRQFLGTMLAAPAIVRFGSLMPMGAMVRKQSMIVSSLMVYCDALIERKVRRPIFQPDALRAIWMGEKLIWERPEIDSVVEYSYEAPLIKLLGIDWGNARRVLVGDLSIPFERDGPVLSVRNLQLEQFGNRIPDFNVEILK